MMTLLSIRALLFLVFLWETGLGQPSEPNYLVLSSGITMDVGSTNNSRQYFHMTIQPNIIPTKKNAHDFFENRGIKFTVWDEKQQELDVTSVSFNDRLVEMINYDGKYFGLISWTKSDDKTKIQVTGYFCKRAHKKHFVVDEMNRSMLNQRMMKHNITLEDKVDVIVFMKTVAGEKVEEVNAGSLATIFCNVRSMKIVTPKFENHTFQHSAIAIDEDKANKGIRLTFQAAKEDHLKIIWCVADQTRKSFTIKVLHAPTAVRIKPVVTDTVMAGGHLKCSAVDGYPQPTVLWLQALIPPNGDQYYSNQTMESTNTFILKENAPIGSVWTMTCVAKNKIGNYTRTVNFTVEMNHTILLSNRISKLEERLRHLSSGDPQMNLAQRLSDLEMKMEKILENQQKNVDKPQPNLETEIKKILGNLKENLVQRQSNLEERVVQQITALKGEFQDNTIGKLEKLPDPVTPDWFVWRVEGISRKIEKRVDEYSRSFFSDGTGGYNMSLNMYTGSPDGLYLVFNLMRGNDDDRLQWPMSRIVLIEIVDAQKAVSIMSRRVCRATALERKFYEARKKAYDRPIDERNIYGDGFVHCVTYGQLKSITGIIRNDSITVRCRVLP